ncbi:DUF262 domain-containing protein [Carboxylicivirga marina]|uniref:DUF262 domain-containing protein n=1 Tax=Carboxylicivirga marina TaxID=2800988 RepID=A0ABS1HRT0_9BACT|nr:DUF262 domain-containing protein [Carboxylicivirga marina]MBK3519958.1 DUF262 domain-containing protein [Carboxylicivirga marina]
MNLQIHTRVRRLIHYIEDIQRGLMQVPAFQRDYIWKLNDKLELFDSIKRGYPIGSILFWKPDHERFGRTKSIGPYDIPDSDGDYFYVLDGFQRLTTLFGCLLNPEKTNLNVNLNIWRREFNICYDLKEEEFFIPRSISLQAFQVNIYNLIDTRYAFQFQRNLIEEDFLDSEVNIWMERYEKLGTQLIDFQLPSIDILGGDIEEAVEIFSRVNSKGAKISADWMISALSYNKEKGFRLGTEIDALLDELSFYNFQNIKRDLILNCITNSFGKYYIDQSKLENLVRLDNFISTSQNTLTSIKKAVKFLFEELLVVDSKLLPYSAQLIFITDFFNQISEPSDWQLNKLKEWFWITTYSGYFTIYSLSKQRKAYQTFQKFLKGDLDDPVFNDTPEIPFDISDFPNKIYMGSVRAKSLILFLLNYSNKFKPIDSSNIEGYKLLYICKDRNGISPPSCVIPFLIDSSNKIPKRRDVSYLINSNDDEILQKYAITDIMREQYLNQDFDALINTREQYILKIEGEFTEQLGLSYQYLFF